MLKVISVTQLGNLQRPSKKGWMGAAGEKERKKRGSGLVKAIVALEARARNEQGRSPRNGLDRAVGHFDLDLLVDHWDGEGAVSAARWARGLEGDDFVHLKVDVELVTRRDPTRAERDIVPAR